MNPGFHCTGQMVDSMYGVVWVNVVDRVAHGGGGVMVWAGVCYGQQTQVHFIDGILNAQRYRDEILRPIFVPFIHDHHLMIIHGPMLQGSVHYSWKLKTSQFLHGQHTHRTRHPLSMFGMFWIGVYNSVSSSCQYPATSHSL